MKQLLAAFCTCLALGLVAVGCGDDDSGDSGGDGGSAATTEQTATTEKQASGGDSAAGGKQIAVEVVDIDYDPRNADVPVGATVKWTNTGNLPHTVTKEEGPGEDFDSGTMQPGDTYEQTFTTPGEIAYHCTIHSGQDGSLTVK
jgi:plastocyanin